jgi:hypothetical protein
MALGPTQPPIQWVAGALSLGVKLPGREAGHSRPSSAEVKECVKLYLQYPNTPSYHGAKLKHRDNFTLIAYLEDAVSHRFINAKEVTSSELRISLNIAVLLICGLPEGACMD